MVDGSGDRAEHWNRLGIYPGKFEGILNILCAGDQLCDKRHAGCRWWVGSRAGNGTGGLISKYP